MGVVSAPLAGRVRRVVGARRDRRNGPPIPVSADLASVLGLFVVGVSVTMANVGTGLTLALAE